MPIKPENKHRYPVDWPRISHQQKVAAGWRCQDCNVRHMAWGWRAADGRFQDLPGGMKESLLRRGARAPLDAELPSGEVVGVIEIVLSVGHIDQAPENCAPENLRCWCQACHNRHDQPYRLEHRREREREEMGTADLFIESAAA